MSRGDQAFRQGDITKAVRAMVKAGVSVKRVEIAHGRIMVYAGDAASSDTKVDSDANEWDGVK